MKLTLLQIFIVFWISALMWVVIEYFYYRFHRREGSQDTSDRSRNK
ncbi:MAG TPA: hypothetical protein VKQ10_04210 [Spirochaetota bacterium]|nr:hypothetical protein [Spirochaetota bacterium]